MLTLKLILTPLLIGLASLAGRRWGPAVSGWLVGLPLTSAPVALFLALEQGTVFASHVAQGILGGLISQAAFCLVYAWLCFRIGWPGCWLASWAAFFALTWLLEQVSIPAPLAFACVVAVLLLLLRFWPASPSKGNERQTPVGEIAGRMVIATSFVSALTSLAGIIGPHLSGLLSPLPIFATIFAIFTQRFQGARATRQILRGVVVSSFACASFFLVVASLLVDFGVPATFGLATVVALLTQGSALWLTGKARGSQEDL